MSYDNLRKGRVSLANHAYFVTTVTQDRRPLFTDLTMARMVIGAMRCLEQENQLCSMAWVLMPDHLHWLFQLQDGELSKVMKLFKGRSAKSLNGLRGVEGEVWQRAFYDRGVRPDEDLRMLSRYIVANPLRAGLVEEIGQYPHWDAVWL